MARIAFFGAGYAGLVSGACFAELGHDVVIRDVVPERIEALQAGEVPFYEPGLDELIARHHGAKLTFRDSLADALEGAVAAFICVPTPSRPDGRLSLRYVEQATRDIAAATDGPLVVVEKSTVPVHTAQRILAVLREEGKFPAIEVATNPEFLREGSAVRDMLEPDRIVVGIAGNGGTEAVLRELYAPILERTGCEFIVTDLETAEMIKHASNSFLALKISYINAVARLCEKVGASVDDVVRGMALDPRIGPHHLFPGVGYGGSCFPKDVANFIAQAQDVGVDLSFLEAVSRINIEQRELLVAKVKRAVWNLEGKTIGVWGLAFKPGTDDLREAPAIDVVKAMEAEGAHVRAYDPAAGAAAKAELPRTEIVADAQTAVEGADALVVMTEWPEFRNADLARLRDSMRRPVIVDGRNLWSIDQMARLGFTYYSFGRPDVTTGEIRKPS